MFDGSLVPGLSGPWQVRPDGDGVVGVYDELRMARGKVQTPGDIAGRKLRPCGTKVCVANPTRTAKSATVVASAPINLQPINLSGMDIETALMMVQSQRSTLLEQQLQSQISEVQKRNEELARLNALVATLQTIRSGAAGSTSGTPIATAGLTQAQRDALNSPDTPKPAGSALTAGGLDAAISSLKGRIDGLNNSSQMDMLRLQSLTNKRNEAFDVMTTFVKKMQDSRTTIIGNMR